MKLTVTFKPPKLNVSLPLDKLDASFGNQIVRDGSGIDPYTGDYVVRSLPHEEQVFRTQGKRMTDDVTVLEISYVSVSNMSGGKTVTIGG